MPRIVALMSALISFDKRNKGLWFSYKPNEEEQKNEYRTKTEGRKKERRVIPSGIIKESINLEDYPKEGKFKSKYDAVVKAKYPDAHSIMPLVRKKKLSTVEKALDFLIQPGIYHVADSINDMSAYYLVEKGSKQYLVNVTKDFIESRELARHFTGRGQTIGNNYFTKALYADLVEKK